MCRQVYPAPFRLVAVSILITEKMYQEDHNSLEVYSLLSGIPIQQLATMEANLLFFLNFDISISEEELGKFIKEELNCNSDSSVEQWSDFNTFYSAQHHITSRCYKIWRVNSSIIIASKPHPASTHNPRFLWTTSPCPNLRKLFERLISILETQLFNPKLHHNCPSSIRM